MTRVRSTGGCSETHPWPSFAQARAAFDRGKAAEAEGLWRDIASDGDLESRHVLQAWHLLRSIGVRPPEDIAKRVLGAVAEVAVPRGHDLLAVYADGSLRYLNFSGAAVVLDERIPSVDPAATELLAIGKSIVDSIGPWEGPLPPLPAGSSRLTMLTPIGPHFGQGPEAVLRGDRTAAAFLDAASRALVAVVALSGGNEK